ncbi:hypothetical protein DNTS_015693 [Danionella cerebrum]|uniref:THAP domain-containing protein 1 n=1 Tax=Danionella cerebrum TaxID=2873325 RepID=A0A553QCY3_9TELE|nr:hypothetical protein DNTS_015693 [Danionella translucida]
MPVCSAYKCKKRSDREYKEAYKRGEFSFHKFPLEDGLRVREWLRRMRWENWWPTGHSVLCSDHFEKDCFEQMGKHKRLRKTAVPVVKRRSLNHRAPEVPIKPKPTPVPASEIPRLEGKYIRVNVDEKTDGSVRGPFHAGSFHDDYCKPQSFYWMKLSECGEDEEADDDSTDTGNDDVSDDSTLETPTNPNSQLIKVTERWQWLSIDVTGPFQESKGPYSHIVIICDYYTKWIEIFPSEKPNSDSIALSMCDAISRYGFPLGFVTPWGARGIQARTKHPDSWHVQLPVAVLRFNCSVHPETKQRPLSLHRSEGNRPYTSHRAQPLSEDDLAKYTFKIQKPDPSNEIETLKHIIRG